MNSKPADIEQWLEALGNPSADRDYKPGHERLLKLLSPLDLHRPRLRIRIAGTNGKGSTAFMLAAALTACGFKVGLYTSPHILAFNERIRINGTPAATAQLWQGMKLLMPIAIEAGASYFETATALALKQFSEARVDVEILEAGVGARLDATTAVAASMALITPIALDHQNWLGDTVTEIAAEKAHAMAGCEYCISAPQSTEVAQVLSAFHAGVSFCSVAPTVWQNLIATGIHQRMNASLAYAAIEHLQAEFPAIDLSAAQQAIVQCQIPGRLQQMHIGEANVWLDAAHNNHAIEALLASLPALLDSLAMDAFDAILVFTRSDRSLKAMLPQLKAYTGRLISNDDPAWPTEAQTYKTATPDIILQHEIQRKPQGLFLVLGSFTTVAAIQKSEDTR
ncbi:bifunctional folylpolyglutamate synthase/dihydrofolate synthase [Mariprofundus ferrooxydans]|nr:bifunctional folylpolyglutamate synthase/dihydrofolate synthase [Mariprofundus ferrooxydans]